MSSATPPLSAIDDPAAQRNTRAESWCSGRDARLSGPMVADLVRGTLVGLGFEVIDLGLATTPTVEMAVVGEGADAGIILTASHNPKQWNALKLLNGTKASSSARPIRRRGAALRRKRCLHLRPGG
jgi:phosphomannomutase